MGTVTDSKRRQARRGMSDEERDQRRAEQQDLVARSIEQLRSSVGWQQWLRTRSAFHGYSFGNQLLIALQHPTATRVAGFRAWLKLGYCVRKGEKGIRIWAPCPPSQKQLDAWRAAGGDPDERPRTHFKLAAVFAQDQVDELPPPAVPAALDPPIAQIVGDSHAEVFVPLSRFAESIGYAVEVKPTDRGDGYCNPAKRLIVVSNELEPNARVATLVHEVAHALMRSEDTKLSYAEEELVVESIAYCVSSTLGLDTGVNSIPYMASWAESANVEVLERTARLVDELARRIEDQLLASGESDQDDETDSEPAAITA